MIRRARLSFKPNVRPSGRAAGQGSAGSERDGGVVPPAEPDPGQDTTTAGSGESSTAPVTGGPVVPQPQENKAEPIEKAATVSNETPPSKTTSTPLQRRKRISTLPNLAKPRVSNSASVVVPPPKTSQGDVPSAEPVSTPPCKNEVSSPEKSKGPSPQKSQGPLSPPQGQLVTLPEKRTPVPQVPQFSPYKKSVLKHQEVSPGKPVECTQKEEPSPLKERPSQKSCGNEFFEVLKNVTPKKMITSNLEKERLRRAQKLRDLLKAELRKERKAWKAKHPVITPLVDPERSKMTMRDFIHFIPMNNPMSSSFEESKSIEKSPPVESPATGLGGKNSAEEDDLDDEDEDDSQLLAPRVKVAEDGSIILDEESLTVEVSRNKAPIVEGNDPIFERGSTTTYSSFRRNSHSKPWSDQETDMFFLAISMVGTDFSMIGQLFPHRERIEIKNKFKKEERMNGWRIDKAFREKKDFDFEFFAQLLEKALEAGKKKKARSKQPRKTNPKSRKKQKGKTAEQSPGDEELAISEEEGADSRTAEKENKRSLDADEPSEVDDLVPVKKKRAKRKKDNAKGSEEENQESQDDDLTQRQKKKSRKNKIAARDDDDKPELQSVDSDGSLKETLVEKKTRVQKKKPNYKDYEFEDDENDADVDVTKDLEVDDAHVACNTGEADFSSQSVALTCEEENSLVLFTEESDYQSGLDDLSSIHHSLSEVNEVVSQASDVSLVALNDLLCETESMNVTQEETSPLTSDRFDHSDKALDAESGQVGEQDLEPKDRQKMPQGRRARPAPNLSRASVKKKVSTEEQIDTEHQATPCDDIDVQKSNDKMVQEEGLSVDQQRQTDKAEEAEDSSVPHGQKETSKKPTVLGRGRLQRPKPNLPARTSTRGEKLDVTDAKEVPTKVTEKCVDVSDVLAQNKKDDTGILNRRGADVSSIDDMHKQDSSFVAQVSSPVKVDVGSESDLSQMEESNAVQQDCDQGDTSKEKPSLSVRGRMRPKPNLTRAPAKNKSSDTEQESQHSQCSEQVLQDSIKSPSHTTDRDQENAVKERAKSSSDSKDECGKSPIKPAPLARGRFQRPKPNLMKASSRKEASDDQEDSAAQGAGHAQGGNGTDLQIGSSFGKPTELVKEVPSVEQHTQEESYSEKPDSMLPQKVDGDNLTEKNSTPLKPTVLPKGRFQRPKPNLGRAAAKRDGLTSAEEPKDIPKVEACAESALESKDSVNEAETSPLPAKSKEESSVTEEDSAALEKPDKEESHGTSVEETMIDKGQTASKEEQKTLKPILTRGKFQRPKPNVNKSATRSVVAAPVVSTAEEEETKTGTTSTENTVPTISLDLEVLSDGGREIKSSPVKDTRDNITQDAEQGEAASLKPVLTRFSKPSPNLRRAAIRKEISTTEPKTLDPDKGQETLKLLDKNPELLKMEDLSDSSIAEHGCKEAGLATEEKSVAIRPVQLKRGRLVKPVPNLVKLSTKNLNPLQSKTDEDLNVAPTLKEKDHVEATSSPANKRKSSSCNVDLSPKRICPSGTPQKSSDLDQVSLTTDPQSSSQSIDVKDTDTSQRSRFGRPLRKLSTATSVSPKSENSSDHLEKEKAVRSVKSSTTKLSKPVSSKSKGRTTLVKIRATQQDEDEEEDADLGFEEENYDLAPDMQNQAPVFIPFSLRSPKPVTAEIEETVEELEIPVDVMELPNSTNQDLGRTPFQSVADSQAQPNKKGQCDGSAEAAMTLISMGSSVYTSNTGEFSSSDQCMEIHMSSTGSQNNGEQLSSPSKNLLSSSHHDVCAMENSITVDPRMVEDPHCSPNLESKTQTDVNNSGIGTAENLPNPINDNLGFPIEQTSYPVMQGHALQQGFNSQDVSVSDCLLGEHGTGEEATFILTLVEIPISDDYAYSCDSNMAENLPAPVLISSGSSQVLTQTLNPSVETCSYEPCVVGQDDKDLLLDQTSRKRSAQCIDEKDETPLHKKPLVSEQAKDLEIKDTAVEAEIDRKVTPKFSVTEPKPEEPAGHSQKSGAEQERPANCPAGENSGTLPVEMPGTSTTEPLNANLPLVYANPAMTSKALKRPGKKPLGFLALVCKEKQSKKANEENRKKKNLPKPKCRKISPTVHGRQKVSSDLNLENDSEVPSSSLIFSPTSEEATPSISQISDNQDADLQTPSKTHDLVTEEEAAPVSEYFFSDIFMEVDD